MVKIIRRRYIAFRLIAKRNLSKNWILENLMQTLPERSGQYQPNFEYLRVIGYDQQSGLCVIRFDHKSKDVIRTSILEMPQNSQDIVRVDILGVSGTLRALRRKFLKDNVEDGRAKKSRIRKGF